MYSPVKVREGEYAEGDLREWAIKLVGGGRLRREPGNDNEVEAGFTGKPGRLASLPGADGVKPICVLRQDLVAKRWVPPSDLVNSNR